MSSSVAQLPNDGTVLFACAKCNSRHPFEDLSQGHQLCKDCRSSYQTIKCNYCRTEFHQDTTSNNGTNGSSKSNSICSKCEQLQAQHGKPGPCVYCNIIAAFIGTKCQRCTNSEKKFGPPMACDHCKQKCAFDRESEESKKKVDGKLLCWLCTMAYKRTLAKARQKEAALRVVSHSKHQRLAGVPSNDPVADVGKSFSSSSSNRHHHGTSSNNNGHRHSSGSASNNISGSTSSPYHRSSTHRHSSSTNHHSHSRDHHHRDSSSKKQRLDVSGPASNNHLTPSVSSLAPPISSVSDARFTEPNNGNDLTAVVTQLKDQVAMLNKKLQMKEKDLLSKDQQIADLKSTNTREQREMREKINTLQKQQADRVSELQTKLIALQKQLVSQTKAASRANSNFIEPPLVI